MCAQLQWSVNVKKEISVKEKDKTSKNGKALNVLLNEVTFL